MPALLVPFSTRKPRSRGARSAIVALALLAIMPGCVPSVASETPVSVFGSVPSTLTWETLAPIPTPRNKPFVAAANGKIYVIGGDNGGTVLNTVEEYDIASDTWTNCAPSPNCATKPTAVWQAAGGMQDGYIFVMGGFLDSGGGSAYAGVDLYDPIANLWNAVDCNGDPCDNIGIATQQAQASSAFASGVIWLIGGGFGGTSNAVVSFDQAPVTNFTDCGGSCYLPGVRSRAGSIGVGNFIYTFGGWDGGGETNTVFEFDTTSGTWNNCGGACPTMPLFGLDAILGVSNGVIYAMDITPNPPADNMYSFDTATYTWTNCGGSCPTIPTAVAGTGWIQVGSRLHLIGGSDSGGVSTLHQAITLPP